MTDGAVISATSCYEVAGWAPLPVAKRRRQDASIFEASVVNEIADRLTVQFQILVDAASVKNVCDNVLGTGWIARFLSRATLEDQEHIIAEVSAFFVAYGPKLREFAFEEHAGLLWPLYLALGPQRTHAYMQSLSAEEVRFFLVPLYRRTSNPETAEPVSDEDIRQEILDFRNLIQACATFANGGDKAESPHDVKIRRIACESKDEQVSLWLLYAKLRHSEEVREHFGAKVVDGELVQKIFTALSERDLKLLANGNAPVRAVLSRFEMRRQMLDYRMQSDAAGRGPRIRCCERYCAGEL
jgi:hypothetical protein